MQNLDFIRLQKDVPAHAALFSEMFNQYLDEQSTHNAQIPDGALRDKWIASILAMQGPADRYLELCYDGAHAVGFLYGKIDREGHRGFIKPGFGYIMEFFIMPAHRRRRYGAAMFERLERLFALGGARSMYLNADPVTGEAFWRAMGFTETAEVSPDNGMVIFEKEIAR